MIIISSKDNNLLFFNILVFHYHRIPFHYVPQHITNPMHQLEASTVSDFNRILCVIRKVVGMTDIASLAHLSSSIQGPTAIVCGLHAL